MTTDKEKILAKIERLMKWKPKAIPSGMRQRDVLNIRKGVLLTLKDFINTLPAEQPSEELEYLATSLEETIGISPHSRETIISYLQQAAQWQKEQTINKACEWLKENIYNRVYKCNDGLGFPTAAFLADFKKAMEE